MMDETLESQILNPRTPLEREIADLGPWFHNLHLPDGTQTAPMHPLGDFPAFKWREIRDSVPDDLSGWRVLDVGCNAGFYSFRLAERGAVVVGIDANENYLRQARWAAEKYHLSGRVAFQQRQVYELAHSDDEYDLVWFMGVFYHLRYPLLALDILARRVRRLMVFQTMTTGEDEIHPPVRDLAFEDREPMRDRRWPRMAFVEERLAGDPTNWWVPNASAVEALLRTSGLRVVDRPAHEIYVCEPDREDPLRIAGVREKELRSATGQRRQD